MTEATTPWYFVDDGVARGPVSRSDLEELFEEKALGADDLVWCPDLEGWTPPADLDVLCDIVPATPPPLPDHVAGDEMSLEERVSAAHRAHLVSGDASTKSPSLPPEVPGTSQEAPGSSASDGAVHSNDASSNLTVAAEQSQSQAAGAADRDTHAWRRALDGCTGPERIPSEPTYEQAVEDKPIGVLGSPKYSTLKSVQALGE